MTRATSIIIGVVLFVLAVLLFTVWREVLDEHGAYISIGFALLAVFLAIVPSRAAPPQDKHRPLRAASR